MGHRPGPAEAGARLLAALFPLFPPPLRGRVRVGGEALRAADPFTPHPHPPPQGGRGQSETTRFAVSRECKMTTRRAFLKAGALAAAGLAAGAEVAPAAEGETLYNGIRLPSPWPPRGLALTAEPMPVPYLHAPPAVIP